MADDAVASFTVMVTGEVESAEIPGQDNAYCKYQLVHGEDWHLVSGIQDAISQTCRSAPVDGNMRLVWNFPVDATFKSYNPFGWPQIVLSVYGVDGMGREVVQGYGCTHVPVTPGQHAVKVRLFRPASSSGIQAFMAWLMGQRPEFNDPLFPASSEGREVTRVQSEGFATVRLNIATKGMAQFGFDTGAD
ncbi:unnamed protein product [Pedinophyceae sp. YPF-701]|nr:unnamed protein product [Pedinophyceae sp. YPF-701]